MRAVASRTSERFWWRYSTSFQYTFLGMLLLWICAIISGMIVTWPCLHKNVNFNVISCLSYIGWNLYRPVVQVIHCTITKKHILEYCEKVLGTVLNNDQWRVQAWQKPSNTATQQHWSTYTKVLKTLNGRVHMYYDAPEQLHDTNCFLLKCPSCRINNFDYARRGQDHRETWSSGVFSMLSKGIIGVVVQV